MQTKEGKNLDEKEGLIKIVTRQHTDGETEEIIMHTAAKISGTGEDYSITYRDDGGELEGCETTLRVSRGRRISINRRGPYSSHIIIEKNVRHLSHHDTPAGSFIMGMSCNEISSDFESGRLSFSYATDIEMVPIGEIEFEFEF